MMKSRKLILLLCTVIVISLTSCATKKPVSTVNIHWETPNGAVDSNVALQKKHGKQKIVSGSYAVKYNADSIGAVDVSGNMKDGTVNVNVDNTQKDR